MIKFQAPLPRLRLYTAMSHYFEVALSFFTNKFENVNSVQNLEEKLKKITGSKFVIAMPLARTGIYLSIKAIIKPKQKVIMSPYTITDVVNMVICAGGIPVFADIERSTCNIDPNSVEKLIDKDTGLVIVTHFYGLMTDVKKINIICKKNKVSFIEDAAQSFGTSLDKKMSGTFGLTGVFSFGMYKNVNAFFGGAVVTNDKKLANKIRSQIQEWPIQPKIPYAKKVISALIIDLVTHPFIFKFFTFWLFRWAFLNNISVINNKLKIDVNPKAYSVFPNQYAVKMSNVQASLILNQLDESRKHMKARIKAANQWYKGLKDIGDIILPPIRNDFSHMYWYFPIQFNKRHDLVSYAMKYGRDITESYHRNCAELQCFSMYFNDCPNAHKTSNSLIYLPTYPRYTKDEINKTIKVIRSFFGK